MRACRPIDSRTSGGSSDAEVNAFAVMPWMPPFTAVVTTVTPVENRPKAFRNARESNPPSAMSPTSVCISPYSNGEGPEAFTEIRWVSLQTERRG